MIDNDLTKSNANLIGYLQRENKKLKEENEDMKQMIKMNKIQIDTLSQNHKNIKYIDIISNYRITNQNLLVKIDTLQKKLQEITTQKLMLQQLNLQSSVEMRATQQLHKDRIDQLQRIIKQMQKRLVQFGKSEKTYDTITGFVERVRQVYSPTEQSIQFMNKAIKLQNQVHLLKIQIQKGKENQQNLLKINGILRHKVVTLQAKLAMPTKNLGQILDKSLKRLMMYFIQTQKRILTGEQSDSQGQQDLQLIAPQLSTYFGQEHIRKQKEYNIPHLDLLKVRGTLVVNSVKIDDDLDKRNHLTKQQKLQRLKIQLEYTRRQLTKNIIDLRQQKDKRKMLQKICEELQSRNHYLIQSNHALQKQIDKFRRKITDFKEKHIKSFDFEQSLCDTSLNVLKIDNNLVDKHKQKQQISNKIIQSQMYDSLQQYKVHIQLLARDLGRNKILKNLPKSKKRQKTSIQQRQKPKLKKSTSNPFLYFNERRQQIFDTKQKNEKMKQQRLQQTQIIDRITKDGIQLDDIIV